MSTENRRPHTVYLSDDVWNALERRHLQLRLDSPAQVSKIEFIEQVLRAGLDALDTRPTTHREPPVEEGLPARANEESPNSSPKPQDRRGRRQSAVERLRQASEPGRPAPIRSAADAEESATSS